MNPVAAEPDVRCAAKPSTDEDENANARAEVGFQVPGVSYCSCCFVLVF